MIAIDTNVLAPVLADDPEPPGLVPAARALVSDTGRIFVPTVVQVETFRVLESDYGLPKATIVDAAAHEVCATDAMSDSTRID